MLHIYIYMVMPQSVRMGMCVSGERGGGQKASECLHGLLKRGHIAPFSRFEAPSKATLPVNEFKNVSDAAPTAPRNCAQR